VSDPLRLLALVALALWPALAVAQATPPPPVFAAGLDVVNLTVTVRDAEGQLVPDLQADDFAVFEDGRRQSVRLFARAVESGQDREEALSVDVGLLLDTSESMIDQLRLSQEAALRFLEAIPRARDLLTILFDADIRVSRFDSEHQQGLIERIQEAKGGGATALYDAIAVYLSRVRESNGRKILVLLTDGEDSTSDVSFSELVQIVRGSAVTIYPIAFTGGFAPGGERGARPKAVLRELAEMTGGEVFNPRASRDLPGIYQKILDELGGQYVLGYTPDNAKQDGKLRKLKVEVKRRGLRIRHRTAYTAPKG
jgi:Ca-activated chloride channel family protein